MKIQPILFSGSMVRAILEGRKRMTRRVAKVDAFGNLLLRHGWCIESDGNLGDVKPERLPWHTGMQLWVRETWRVTSFEDAPYSGLAVEYRADNSRRFIEFDEYDKATKLVSEAAPWRPSIFMPRWASRITLEIAGVRCERLQDISTDDVEAEGFDVASKLPPVVTLGTNLEMLAWQVAQDLFAKTWDALNGKRGFPWEANPWVWVVEFKRVAECEPSK